MMQAIVFAGIFFPLFWGLVVWDRRVNLGPIPPKQWTPEPEEDQ